jgi:hypothetical protein
VALRYVKTKTPEAGQTEQYQLFATADYPYRVFVTNLKDGERCAKRILRGDGSV